MLINWSLNAFQVGMFVAILYASQSNFRIAVILLKKFPVHININNMDEMYVHLVKNQLIIISPVLIGEVRMC